MTFCTQSGKVATVQFDALRAKFIDHVIKGNFLEVSSLLRYQCKNPEIAKKLLEDNIPFTVETNNEGKILEESAPAVVYAAKYGHIRVVNLLIKRGVDVNQPGFVAFDGYIIQAATALWCAAGNGHLAVVQVLVGAGADVNKTTKTSSTPLRAACFDGRLEVVKYLLSHGADCNIANVYQNTCLMIASFRGHTGVVCHLLTEGGMDANRQASCGATALLFAAESGHLEIVKSLVQRGATLLCNQQGVDPLYMAAEAGHSDIVYYLINDEDCPLTVAKERCINALELLGAHVINDRDHRNISAGYRILEIAMQMRLVEPNPVAKQIRPPVQAYNSQMECSTHEELSRIQYDIEALEMEALMIRERILGHQYIDLGVHIIYQGAVYADQGRFSRCIDLWLYALDLKQRNTVRAFKDILRLAELLAQMVSLDVALHYPVISSLLTAAISELQAELRRTLCTPHQPHHQTEERVHAEAWDTGLHNLAYLLILSLQVLMTDSQEGEFMRLVYGLVKRDYRLKTGATLLHMATDETTKNNFIHIMDTITFPSLPLCKLLLLCGADPTARDKVGDTPLHLAIRCERRGATVEETLSLVGNLLQFGSHADSPNSAGESPYHAPGGGLAALVLRLHLPVRSLQCLAAEVAVRAGWRGPLVDGHGCPRQACRLVEIHSPWVPPPPQNA